MILAWDSGSGRAWQGWTGRGTMEWGAEPHFHQVWRTHGPGVGPFSCREGGQADEALEQDKADVVQSPKAGWGGLLGGLRVPAQPGPCWQGHPSSPGRSHLMASEH